METMALVLRTEDTRTLVTEIPVAVMDQVELFMNDVFCEWPECPAQNDDGRNYVERITLKDLMSKRREAYVGHKAVWEGMTVTDAMIYLNLDLNDPQSAAQAQDRRARAIVETQAVIDRIDEFSTELGLSIGNDVVCIFREDDGPSVTYWSGVPSSKVNIVAEFFADDGFVLLLAAKTVMTASALTPEHAAIYDLRMDTAKQIKDARQRLELWTNGSVEEIVQAYYSSPIWSVFDPPQMVRDDRTKKIDQAKRDLARLEPFYEVVFGQPCP